MLFRNPGIAIITFAFCLGLSFPSYAQSDKSKTDKDTIRPFKVKIPQKELIELRRRIAETRWPDKETDPSQGVPLAACRNWSAIGAAATTGVRPKRG